MKEVTNDIAACFKEEYSYTLWASNFGAIGIDPSNIFIYCVLPTDEKVNEFIIRNLMPELKFILLQKMSFHGYPIETLKDDWLGLYSEEECKRKANGNWYYFFK